MTRLLHLLIKFSVINQILMIRTTLLLDNL